MGRHSRAGRFVVTIRSSHYLEQRRSIEDNGVRRARSFEAVGENDAGDPVIARSSVVIQADGTRRMMSVTPGGALRGHSAYLDPTTGVKRWRKGGGIKCQGFVWPSHVTLTSPSQLPGFEHTHFRFGLKLLGSASRCSGRRRLTLEFVDCTRSPDGFRVTARYGYRRGDRIVPLTRLEYNSRDAIVSASGGRLHTGVWGIDVNRTSGSPPFCMNAAQVSITFPLVQIADDIQPDALKRVSGVLVQSYPSDQTVSMPLEATDGPADNVENETLGPDMFYLGHYPLVNTLPGGNPYVRCSCSDPPFNL